MNIPRIAIVVSHPIHYFCSWYRELARHREWEVMVFFGSAAGAKPYYDSLLDTQVHWEGLRLESFHHEFLNGDQVVPVDNLLDAVNLGNRLDAFGPDVVLLHGYAQRMQRRAFLWARRAEKLILMISDAEMKVPRSLLTRAAKRYPLRWLFRRVNGFLTVGDANEEYYRRYGVDHDRLFRNPFPIDWDLYDAALIQRETLRAEFRARYSIAPDGIVCACVGKFEPRKAQGDILQALSHPEVRGLGIVLFLAGSGKTEQVLKSMVSPGGTAQVIFPGFVPPVELPGLYAATDIYVQPSQKDPHPLAITEAVAMGCPVVASSAVGSVGPTDDVQPDRNGLVYPAGDTAGLASALARLARNPTLRDSFGAASREISAENSRLARGEGLRAALTALGLF